MKKVLLTSAAVLAVFSAAAPVFAQGENPNASNQLIQKKYVSWRDAADEAQRQVELHAADIQAEAEASVEGYAKALETAKAELAKLSDYSYAKLKDSYKGDGASLKESDVEFQGGNSQAVAAKREQLQENVNAAQKAYDKALKEAVTTVTNKYRKHFEEVYIAAAQAQGNYYNESGVEANRTNEQRIADDQAAQGTAASAAQAAADQAATKPEDGKPGAVDQAKKADAAAKKAGANAKAGQKALPKTHAAK